MVRIVLLLFRSVPPVIWAFLVVLVILPGIWPGAIALAVYNVGVLGRLFDEVFEDRDDRSAGCLRSIGATPLQAVIHATIPETAPRIVSLGLYRWEVVVRESVMVGIVGAGALGQLMNEHLAARDLAAVMGVIVALIVVALVIDHTSDRLRRMLR